MPAKSIPEYFGQVEHPRCLYLVEHRLLDIVTLALCAVLAGADTLAEVVAFGQQREA